MNRRINGGAYSPDCRQTLVIYDVSDNKRRNRLVKILESYGYRVQESAFEIYATKRKYEKLLAEIRRVVIQKDNVRIYRLNSSNEITIIGSSLESINEEAIVV